MAIVVIACKQAHLWVTHTSNAKSESVLPLARVIMGELVAGAVNLKNARSVPHQ